MWYYYNSFFNGGRKELLIKFSRRRYVVVRCSIRSWACPLHVQRFVWNMNKDVEWFIWFLCFGLAINNYGSLVRDKNWPIKWR